MADVDQFFYAGENNDEEERPGKRETLRMVLQSRGESGGKESSLEVWGNNGRFRCTVNPESPDELSVCTVPAETTP